MAFYRLTLRFLHIFPACCHLMVIFHLARPRVSHPSPCVSMVGHARWSIASVYQTSLGMQSSPSTDMLCTGSHTLLAISRTPYLFLLSRIKSADMLDTSQG